MPTDVPSKGLAAHFLRRCARICLFFCLGTACQTPAPPLSWRSDLDVALQEARAQHRPVAIDFTATWCASCAALEERTYVDPAVRRAASRFTLVKVDATNIDTRVQALFDRYGVTSLPAVVFVGASGQVLATPRLKGFVAPASFVEMLGQVS